MTCDTMTDSHKISDKNKDYYFANLEEDNGVKGSLIDKMNKADKREYGGASGQELVWKMRALPHVP